jgi:hypothetical protein
METIAATPDALATEDPANMPSPPTFATPEQERAHRKLRGSAGYRVRDLLQ